MLMYLGPAFAASPARAAAAYPAGTLHPNATGMVADAGAGGLNAAELLLNALVRRGLDIQERSHPASAASTTAAAPAAAHRAPLASRMSGPAAHRIRSIPSPATDLAGYMAVLARTSPGGHITGRFNDWRTVSIYRRNAGRHNGYDVALPLGSSVVVGWAGRVTDVKQWYGKEYGITVTSPEGFHTTYGHLAPTVRVGALLEPGDVVGITVRDHVDIKMFDGSGHAIDFEKSVPLAAPRLSPIAALVAPAPRVEPPKPPAPLGGPEWTRRADAISAAVSYVRLRRQEASLIAAGTQSPIPALQQVRHQLSEARSQLALVGVPEEVLLAAFLDEQSLPSSFAISDPSVAGANPLADWLRRQQMLQDARKAAPQLKSLLQDLNG